MNARQRQIEYALDARQRQVAGLAAYEDHIRPINQPATPPEVHRPWPEYPEPPDLGPEAGRLLGWPVHVHANPAWLLTLHSHRAFDSGGHNYGRHTAGRRTRHHTPPARLLNRAVTVADVAHGLQAQLNGPLDDAHWIATPAAWLDLVRELRQEVHVGIDPAGPAGVPFGTITPQPAEFDYGELEVMGADWRKDSFDRPAAGQLIATGGDITLDGKTWTAVTGEFTIT